MCCQFWKRVPIWNLFLHDLRFPTCRSYLFLSLLTKLADLLVLKGLFGYLSIIYDHVRCKNSICKQERAEHGKMLFLVSLGGTGKEPIYSAKDKAILIFNIGKDTTMISFSPCCQKWFSFIKWNCKWYNRMARGTRRRGEQLWKALKIIEVKRTLPFISMFFEWGPT